MRKMRGYLSLIAVAAAVWITGNGVAAVAVDPVVGHWIWHQRFYVVLNEDGTAVSDVGHHGVWTPEAGADRVYTVTWNDGQFVDRLQLGEDGDHLLGGNRSGEAYAAERAPEVKKVSTKPVKTLQRPAGAQMLPSMGQSALGSAASSASEANTFQPTGKWRWSDGRELTFGPDGVVTYEGGEARWSWRNEASGEFRVQWKDSVDLLALSANGEAVEGVKPLTGEAVTGARVSAKVAQEEERPSFFGTSSPNP